MDIMNRQKPGINEKQYLLVWTLSGYIFSVDYAG